MNCFNVGISLVATLVGELFCTLIRISQNPNNTLRGQNKDFMMYWANVVMSKGSVVIRPSVVKKESYFLVHLHRVVYIKGIVPHYNYPARMRKG